ncbi:hypothetical protein [Micromonospora sp. CB01531]|uniref:hypothetical protein n=1 Tax=Micromonospora sp. CB01531 TaxID=1718947 RepID=UPI000A66BE49|nr:hypothetical protein [Micromonospora sp. CB01531]
MRDPWEDIDEDVQFVADHIYSGSHEVISDLVLMHEVLVDFEVWVGDFRAQDVLHGPIPASQWERHSPFSESKSIELSNMEVRP